MDPTVGVVVAALVGAVGTTTAAVVGPILNRRWLERNVGRANGKGNVVEIGEKLLIWSLEHQQQDQDRFEEILEEQKRVRQELNDFKTLGTYRPPSRGGF